MYYQSYEDYMRQVLGYPVNAPNVYESYNFRNNQNFQDTYCLENQVNSSMTDEEIKACYPEIYNLVYPMVCKVCETNTQQITKELIEKMTDEVYSAIEDTSTVVNVRVNTTKTETNNSASQKRVDREQVRQENRTSREGSKDRAQEVEKRNTETRRENSNLRDLIKILILLKLFGNRPSNRPENPRPPFPQRPGMNSGPFYPNGRTGIEPRNYTNYLEF